MAQNEIVFDDVTAAQKIYGSMDENLKILEREFIVSITERGERIIVAGDEQNIALVKRTVAAMGKMLRYNDYLDDQSVRYCVNLVRSGTENDVSVLGSESVLITPKGKPIKPKTLGQKKYILA